MPDFATKLNEICSGGKAAILSGEFSINEGTVCENFVAQLLKTHGFDSQSHINSKKTGELDFLVEHENRVLPAEVTSGAAFKRHDALDNLMGVSPLDEAYIFCPSNVERDDCYTYFPIYMAEFLQKTDRYIPESL